MKINKLEIENLIVVKKIISLQGVNQLTKQLKARCEIIVLAGGCFDILHFGHIKFLEKAKKAGDILIIALENDEKIKRLKGKNRPIHSQKMRAEMLAALKSVDFIICLPFMKNNKDYLDLVEKVKPNIIAVTAGDPKLKNKKQQAKFIGGKVKIIINRIKTPSTREIVEQFL